MAGEAKGSKCNLTVYDLTMCTQKNICICYSHSCIVQRQVVYKTSAYCPWCTYLHLHGEVYLGALQISDISDIPLPPPSSTEPIRMTVCKWLVPAVRVRTYPLSARSSHEDGVSLFFLEADVMFCPGEETARAWAALQEHLTVFLSRVCATNPWLCSESVKFMFSPLHYKGSAKVTSEAADIPQNFALYRCHLLMCSAL